MKESKNNEQLKPLKPSLMRRSLNTIEAVGNKLPDPAILFLLCMVMTWIASAIFSGRTFSEIDPRSGAPIQVISLVTGPELAKFLAGLVSTFTSFAPLGLVLVAMFGVGVAEHSGLINTALRLILKITPKTLLTPVLILAGLISHTAIDAGYVLVIPIGAVIFLAAGRHPLAGIAAAFAGVSGGFSANFIPSAVDPLIQGFTQSAARLIDPDILVNPLCNWYFTSASSLLIILVGWYITDRIVEPRLENTPIDEEIHETLCLEPLTRRERLALWFAAVTMITGITALIAVIIPADSAFRSSTGELTSFDAPLMQSIVTFIFLLLALPGAVYGFVSKRFKGTHDLIETMNKAMHSLSSYIVMAFFCSLFIYSFGRSNLGALIALKGATLLKTLALPGQITIVGMIVLSAFINLFIGSASAKWALIGPVLVPMLMQVGIAPELTQAAYRVGDSASNIVTPLMPFFPLILVYCQRYVKKTGIGTVVSMMMPYTMIYLFLWTLLLLAFWGMGIPLGIQGAYVYP